MIKLLKQYQIQSTPFEATKNWAINNIDNSDVVLFESTGSEDGLPIALEFMEYHNVSASYNYKCNIALEQGPDDAATILEGLNVSGIFYPESEPVNNDGTYKRSIYHQVKTMFYNTYFDQTKMWGLENIDFDLSKTKKILSDNFRLIDIPRGYFGDKIAPNTVKMYDNSFDNPYIIKDDGNGNLFAGTNLFAHQQELGEYKNEFHADMSSSYCDDYWENSQSIVPLLFYSITPNSGTLDNLGTFHLTPVIYGSGFSSYNFYGMKYGIAGTLNNVTPINNTHIGVSEHIFNTTGTFEAYYSIDGGATWSGSGLNVLINPYVPVPITFHSVTPSSGTLDMSGLFYLDSIISGSGFASHSFCGLTYGTAGTGPFVDVIPIDNNHISASAVDVTLTTTGTFEIFYSIDGCSTWQDTGLNVSVSAAPPPPLVFHSISPNPGMLDIGGFFYPSGSVVSGSGFLSYTFCKLGYFDLGPMVPVTVIDDYHMVVVGSEFIDSARYFAIYYSIDGCSTWQDTGLVFQTIAPPAPVFYSITPNTKSLDVNGFFYLDSKVEGFGFTSHSFCGLTYGGDDISKFVTTTIIDNYNMSASANNVALFNTGTYPVHYSVDGCSTWQDTGLTILATPYVPPPAPPLVFHSVTPSSGALDQAGLFYLNNSTISGSGFNSVAFCGLTYGTAGTGPWGNAGVSDDNNIIVDSVDSLNATGSFEIFYSIDGCATWTGSGLNVVVTPYIPPPLIFNSITPNTGTLDVGSIYLNTLVSGSGFTSYDFCGMRYGETGAAVNVTVMDDNNISGSAIDSLNTTGTFEMFYSIDGCATWTGSGLDILVTTSSISQSYGTVLVYPFNGDVVFFDSSASFDAGTYRVTYIDGAMLYSEGYDVMWTIHDPYTPTNGHKILYNDNGYTSIFAPGDRTGFVYIVDCRLANTGSYVNFVHTGGSIGVYLQDDPYTDNYGMGLTYKLDRLS